MPSFLRMEDGTYVARAAIRSFKRCADASEVELEFNDGSKRRYPSVPGAFEYHALTGQIIPAAAGWRVAFYNGMENLVEYSGIPAFRVRPEGGLEPLTISGWSEPEYTAVVDPQGRFIPQGVGSFDDEAGFIHTMRRRLEPVEDVPSAPPSESSPGPHTIN